MFVPVAHDWQAASGEALVSWRFAVRSNSVHFRESGMSTTSPRHSEPTLGFLARASLRLLLQALQATQATGTAAFCVRPALKANKSGFDSMFSLPPFCHACLWSNHLFRGLPMRSRARRVCNLNASSLQGSWLTASRGLFCLLQKAWLKSAELFFALD